MLCSEEKRFWQLVVLIFGLILSAPFFYDKLIIGHDIAFHLGRIAGLADGFAAEHFPVKMYGWFMNGYGYPVGIFYPDLFFYIPATLCHLGLSLTASYKIFGVLINLATLFIAQFAFVRLFSSWRTGSIVAVIYGSFLYRLINVYSRAAVGEALAMAFLPLAAVGLWLTLRRDPKYWPLIVVGFTGVASAHIISTLMLTVVLALILLISIPHLTNKKVLGGLVKAVFFTACLNVWFYLPFVDFYGQYDFVIKSVTQSKVFDHFAGSRLSPADIIGLHGFVGIAVVLFIILYGGLRLKECFTNRRYVSSRNETAFVVGLTLGLFSLYFWSDLFPWATVDNIAPLSRALAIMQFSYRIMMWGAVALAVAAAVAVEYVCDRNKRLIVVSLLFITTLNMGTLFSPMLKMDSFWRPQVIYEQTTWRDALAKLTLPDTHAPLDESAKVYGDLTVKQTIDLERGADNPVNVTVFYADYAYADSHSALGPTVLLSLTETAAQLFPPDKTEPHNIISAYAKHGTKITFTVNAPQETTVRLPLFYYPLYEATDENDNSLALIDGDLHIMHVVVSAGEHNVTVRYVGKLSWQIAEIFSLLVLMAFIWQVWREHRL